MTNKKINNRGLSGVVTTVLIILIVIVAVVLIWIIISPVVKQSGQQVETERLGLTTSFVVQEYSLNETKKELGINIKRNPGNGNISSFIVTLEDSRGNRANFRQNIQINELESRQVNINYSNGGLIDIASIAITPVFSVGGKEVVGKTSSTIKIKDSRGSASSGSNPSP